MQFDSIEYGLFLLVVTSAFHASPSRLRPLWVLGASVWFYARWNAVYLLLILLSATTDYVAGRLLGPNRSGRRGVLLLSLVVNLGLLGLFKYGGFTVDSLNQLAGWVGISARLPTLDLLLPVGISFYTFQTLSYTIDRYRGTLAEAERDPLRFGTYVLFFPQLVAGPIERADRLLPQLGFAAPFDAARIAGALEQLLWGLFKKVVVADRLAVYVDAVYGNAPVHNATTYAVATVFFAVQIYCDFSGYTDIAIGSARLLGVDLGENFARPYFATSPRDFWRRWHISLSTWLRDYLYIPLGGSRGTTSQTAFALFATMLLGGLWHGAAWTFVLWGAYHGGLLALQRRLPRGLTARVPTVLRIVGTFALVCLGWVLFRSPSIGDAALILRRLFTLDLGRPFLDLVTFSSVALPLLLLVGWELWDARRGSPLKTLASLSTPVRWSFAYLLLLLIALLGVQEGSPFIYFQF